MILLVTGSRALYDTQKARKWTMNALRPRLTGPDAPQLVVTGDALGADDAARRLVGYGSPVGIAVWELDGEATMWAPGYALGLTRRWTEEKEPQCGDREAWKRWPLKRNAAMVAWCAEQARGGADVRCVALIAPWSNTRGTQHTVRLATEHGLPVETLVCPMEYAP